MRVPANVVRHTSSRSHCLQRQVRPCALTVCDLAGLCSEIDACIRPMIRVPLDPVAQPKTADLPAQRRTNYPSFQGRSFKRKTLEFISDETG